MRNVQKFEKILESYVYIKECRGINNERAELGFDLDIYDLKNYCEDLIRIAEEYEIKIFKINDDYDIDELNEYIIYSENKLINQLHYKLSFMYQYD